MPRIVLWSWDLAPDLSPAKARAAYRDVLKCDPCSYCGSHDPKAVVDHIESRASYGEDEWDNLTGACRNCNSSKRADSLLGFLLKEPVGDYEFGGYVPGLYERRLAKRQRSECLAARMAA